MTSESFKDNNILITLLMKVVEAKGNEMEVEYKDRQEQVYALQDGIGFAIASLDSSSEEAGCLREELHKLSKKKKIICLAGQEYTVSARMFDSLGEYAFRVKISPK